MRTDYFEANHLEADETVLTRIDYLASDPFAVRMLFHNGEEPVEWIFARALLVAGMVMPVWVGEGDVATCLADDDHVAVRLQTPSGRATFLLPLSTVCRFVRETLLHKLIGSEMPNDDSELLSVEKVLGLAEGQK